jgi:two-component system response regulator YesN
VQGAVDYILNHYGQEITLDMIARKVNSSPSRLSALFRENFGVSIIKWQDHIRMQKAKELIRHTNEPIGSIASHVGYPDALYFSRRCKDHFGMAPSDFRKT